MTSLSNVISYMRHKYPDKQSLSTDRLKMMVFLADWKSAIIYGHQMTNVKWEIKQGKLDLPYPGSEKEFSSYRPSKSIRHSLKQSLKQWLGWRRLNKKEKDILDFVINSSWDKNWDEFLQLIYSTYPVIAEQEAEKLDLDAMAKKYNGLVRPLLGKTGIEAQT